MNGADTIVTFPRLHALSARIAKEQCERIKKLMQLPSAAYLHYSDKFSKRPLD